LILNENNFEKNNKNKWKSPFKKFFNKANNSPATFARKMQSVTLELTNGGMSK